MVSNSANEKYLEAERELLAKYTASHRGDQLGIILQDWFPKLREKAKEKNGGPDDYRELLEDAEAVLNDIRAALFSNVEYTSKTEGRFPLGRDKKDDEGWLWLAPSSFQMNHQPSNWRDVSPVDRHALAAAVGEYVKRGWLQHSLIDWACINALLFDEISRLTNGIKSGVAFGEFNWAYTIAGNHQEKLLVWTFLLRIGAFVVRWVIPGATIAGLGFSGYQRAAGVVASIWGLYIIYRTVTWWSRRGYRLHKQTHLDKYNEMVGAMSQAWVHSDHKLINPGRLKELVLAAESKGAILSPAIHSLLDRAIQRDPAVLVREGRY